MPSKGTGNGARAGTGQWQTQNTLYPFIWQAECTALKPKFTAGI